MKNFYITQKLTFRHLFSLEIDIFLSSKNKNKEKCSELLEGIYKLLQKNLYINLIRNIKQRVRIKETDLTL